VAVQIESESLHNYLVQLFELDWWLSHRIFLPIVYRNLTPPAPPIDHLVISEVFYSANPAAEWIEIYNPTDEDIELDAWKLGDDILQFDDPMDAAEKALELAKDRM